MIATPVPATLISQLKAKIETREARIGVIGLGYVGLPLTLLYVSQRFAVTGFDIDQRKVDALTTGRSYIYRIPAEEIQEARAKGFVATSDFCRIAEMDAIIICVPTPLNEHHEPDTSFIINTAHAIAPHLRAGQLVVLESTTYPGTTEELLVPILENENPNGLRAARSDVTSEMAAEFYVAFSPEREDPGNTTVARREIPKVVGGLDPQAAELAAKSLRDNIQPCRASFVARSRGDDQATREHLPLREYCPGQRIEAPVLAYGIGYLGGDRRGGYQTFWVPTVLPRTWARWSLHPNRSILSLLEGQRV